MSGLRVIFMGTPDFSVPALEALIGSTHEVVAVFSQPPRPKGRGKKVQPSPVHAVAEAHNIPVFTPKSLRKDAAARDDFKNLDPDVAVVAAYGLLLPKDILDAPRFGCLNLHASILPRWRGAAPIQYAIWKGDDVSGVGIMQMSEGLDEGDVAETHETPITETTTAQELHDKLSRLGADAIVPFIDRLAAGDTPDWVAQDESRMTYAPMLKKSDGVVDWTQSAQEIDRQIRALNPWPGVWTQTPDGKRMKILKAVPSPLPDDGQGRTGQILDREGRVLCGGNTCLQLQTVQPENSKKMDVTAAVNGGYIAAGDIF